VVVQVSPPPLLLLALPEGGGTGAWLQSVIVWHVQLSGHSGVAVQ
jgi:hypothetical protein